jgi:galactokinase
VWRRPLQRALVSLRSRCVARAIEGEKRAAVREDDDKSACAFVLLIAWGGRWLVFSSVPAAGGCGVSAAFCYAAAAVADDFGVCAHTF